MPSLGHVTRHVDTRALSGRRASLVGSRIARCSNLILWIGYVVVVVVVVVVVRQHLQHRRVPILRLFI